MRYSKRLELFEKLRSEHSGLLTSVLWKLTGEADLFEEAFQYALLGILTHLEKLTGRKSGAYIYRIALSANSKAWRNRAGKNGQISRATEFINPKTNSPDEEEMFNLVRKEIAKLPEKQAQSIVMRYIDQREYEEIAEKLNCTEDTARSHVSKAVAALRNKLAGHAALTES